MNKSKIKICGIKNLSTLKCCIENKVNYFGLIFYKKSPRYINFNNALKLINYSKNKNIYAVGVFVNEQIDSLNKSLKEMKINYIQLHGHEDNDYIKYIKKNNNIKIIKAISINDYKDLLKTSDYKSADMLLFDYKPLKKELPGGNAKSFNWNVLKNIEVDKDWFLSGGVNIDNITQIQNYTIPYGIDISSGVEAKLGYKSNKKIKSLIKIYE